MAIGNVESEWVKTEGGWASYSQPKAVTCATCGTETRGYVRSTDGTAVCYDCVVKATVRSLGSVESRARGFGVSHLDGRTPKWNDTSDVSTIIQTDMPAIPNWQEAFEAGLGPQPTKPE